MMCACGVYMIVCICMICVRGRTMGQDMQGHVYVCAQSCLTLCKPMECSLPGSSVRGIFQARNTGVDLPFPSPGHLPDPGIEPMSLEFSALEGRFFTTCTTWDMHRCLNLLKV